MTAKANKTNINEHLSRSLGKYSSVPLDSNDRKQQIKKHIRISKG